MAALARVSELRVVAELPGGDSPVAVAGPHRLMPHIEVDPEAERARVAKETGGEFVQADVTRAGDWAKLVAAATAKFGRLDCVVNNAGWTHRNKPFLEVTETEFDKVYAVNVKSIYLSALHALPVMRKVPMSGRCSRQGRLICRSPGFIRPSSVA